MRDRHRRGPAPVRRRREVAPGRGGGAWPWIAVGPDLDEPFPALPFEFTGKIIPDAPLSEERARAQEVIGWLGLKRDPEGDWCRDTCRGLRATMAHGAGHGD